MSVWVTERGLDARIQVSSEWPRFLPEMLSAVIVANAARDHAAAVQWALSARVAVLVEKPIALTAAAAQQLVGLAIRRNTHFAAAHVFLFARYLGNFSKYVAHAGKLRSLQVHWADPEFETRYGEKKKYDPSLSVLSDCLPHVLSMVGTLTPELPDTCKLTRFLRGGACLELELMMGDIPCSICLERNSDRRRRVITARVGQKNLQLDFSVEPGVISDGVTTLVGDPDWGVKQGPVAQLLAAFLTWAGGGEYDSRLDVSVGLRACQVVDNAIGDYRLAMKSWLLKRLSSAEVIDDALRYALKEILQSEGPLSGSAVDQQIERVRQRFSDEDGTQLLSALNRTQHPAALIKAIVKLSV